MQIKRRREQFAWPFSLPTYRQLTSLFYVLSILGTFALLFGGLRDDAYHHQVDSVRRNPRQKSVPIDPELKKEAMAYIRSIESFDRGKALKFFHIPKTAGTAIEFAAGSIMIPWGSCLFNHKPKRDICHYPESIEWPQYIGWWHLPRQFFPLANVDPYQNAELFGVVRDSYDRMVSEFYYICTLKVLEWRPDQCDRSRLFEKEYMNEWIQKKLISREQDSRALTYLSDNGHFTPQYEFIVGPNEVRMIDYVLRLGDELNPHFDSLMKAFKLSQIKLKKLNALGAEARGQEHLGVDTLNKETIESIHQIYAQDFDLGYAKRTS